MHQIKHMVLLGGNPVHLRVVLVNGLNHVTPSRLALPLAILLILAGIGSASQHYDITPDPHVDTPSRTVEYNNDTYEISALGRVDPGVSVDADVTAPSDEAYEVTLYDKERQELDAERSVGDDSIPFPTTWPNGSSYSPGTYVFTVSHEGDIQTVAPLVVSGYEVEADAPGQAAPGSTVTIDATVTQISGSVPIDRVQVVIGNDADERRVTLQEQEEGEYSRTFTLDTLSEGSYSLYVVVQGSDTVLGRQEMLSVSDSQAFDIESSSQSTATDSEPTERPSSPQPTSTATPTVITTTASSQTSDGASATPTSGQTAGDGGTLSGGAGTPTDADGVITPNPPTSASSDTNAPGQPLGLLPPLVALFLIAALAVRRR